MYSYHNKILFLFTVFKFHNLKITQCELKKTQIYVFNVFVPPPQDVCLCIWRWVLYWNCIVRSVHLSYVHSLNPFVIDLFKHGSNVQLNMAICRIHIVFVPAQGQGHT